MFLQDLKAQWKSNTYQANFSAIKNHVLLSLGTTKLRDLEHQDVLLWYNQLNRAAGTRNRVLANLSTMKRHAEILGIRQPGTSPCRHMRKHKSEFDAEYLDAKAFAKLGSILRRHEDRYDLPVSFIWFLVLTGCRKGEAKAAQWSQIEDNKLILPDSKTGPKTIWLGKQVVRLLCGLPRTSDFIFVSEDKKAQAGFNKSLKIASSKFGKNCDGQNCGYMIFGIALLLLLLISIMNCASLVVFLAMLILTPRQVTPTSIRKAWNKPA